MGSNPPQQLEDQLRTMILSDVTIADPPARGDGNRRGRGRGRGQQQQQQQHTGRHNARGFNRNPQNQANQVQQQAAPAHNPPYRGRSSTIPHRGNQGRSFSAHSQQMPPLPSAFNTPVGPPGNTGIPNNHAGPRSNSRRTSNQSYSGGQSPLSPPNILQRPYTNGVTPNTGSGAPASQYARFPPPRHYGVRRQENPMLQTEYLERIAKREIPKVEITLEEVEALETFRKHLDDICQKAFTEGYSGDIVVFSLLGFGSLASGFAMPGSDMDLAIVPGWKDPSKIDTPLDKEIPRLFEKAILEANLGARLLTRARVPILKVCQTPSDQLYTALYEERKKWDGLPEEEKWEDFVSPDTSLSQKPLVDLGGDNKTPSMPQQNGHGGSGTDKHLTVDVEASKQSTADNKKSPRPRKPKTPKAATPKETSDNNPDSNTRNSEAKGDSNNHVNNVQKRGPWLREKVLGPLDFPKHGIGIQCDVNFGNPLGLHNTSLLRCYSMCDPRVRPIVLFIKAWAKRRKINSSYSGTLSSYGWVLMALHYLVNIASPPVLPNLQLAWRPPPEISGMTKALQDTMVQGYEVRFWRNEDEIRKSAREGKLTTNNQTVGELLRGFFHYYASPPPNYGPRQPSFFWTQEVLSLRTLGGIRTKQDKSWTGANTTIKNGKEIRNRYLFAIEDPFELDHNVARTVTHNGIVAIRDEFRRAWRIVTAVGRDVRPEGDLFDEIIEVVPPPSPTPTAASAQASNQASGETQAKNEASTEDMEIFATAEEAADAMARHEQENFEQDIGRNDPHGKTVPYPGLALH